MVIQADKESATVVFRFQCCRCRQEIVSRMSRDQSVHCLIGNRWEINLWKLQVLDTSQKVRTKENL